MENYSINKIFDAWLFFCCRNIFLTNRIPPSLTNYVRHSSTMVLHLLRSYGLVDTHWRVFVYCIILRLGQVQGVY